MSKYIYQNSRGESVDLCASPLWVATFNDLRSYAYEPIFDNDVFYGHDRRKNVEKPMTFQYYRSGRAAFNDFYENHVYRVLNYDVVAKEYGRLYYGDYFAVGYFPSAAIETYDPIRGLWTAQMPYFMPVEVWRRELPAIILTGDQDDPSSVPAVPLANFPSNYPHGYVSGDLVKVFTNDSAFPSPFRLSISGSCTNPAVTIGSHVYNVNVSVPSGSRLIIDSAEKTIVLYDSQNNAQNVFAYQNHDADKYVFEPIPVGDFTIRYQNIPEITLTLYEERSAPKWT